MPLVGQLNLLDLAGWAWKIWGQILWSDCRSLAATPQPMRHRTETGELVPGVSNS
jgi:hypothetical protein